MVLFKINYNSSFITIVILLCFIFKIQYLSAQLPDKIQLSNEIKVYCEKIIKNKIYIFHQISKKKFACNCEKLINDTVNINEKEYYIKWLKLNSELLDPHTKILKYNSVGLPIYVYLFDDGWYIIGADSNNINLIGLKILGIEKYGVVDLRALFIEIIPSRNESYVKSEIGTMFLDRDILMGLGISKDSSGINMTLMDSSLRTHKLHINYKDNIDINKFSWIRKSSKVIKDPIIGNYGIRGLPEYNTLYIQLKSCIEMETKSVLQFGKDIQENLNMLKPKKIVIDLRLNGGGNYYLFDTICDILLKNKYIINYDVYIIWGRFTNSAAVINAYQWYQTLNATSVGVEMTGGNLNHLGDTQTFEFENSNLSFMYSTKYHYFNRKVKYGLIPDVKLSNKYSNYYDGIDICLEYIIGK